MEENNLDVLRIVKENIKFKLSTKSERTRIESVEKYLVRNPDAILVKLDGAADMSMVYKPGHVCGIEEGDQSKYNVFVGSHLIGQLPDEAVSFANEVDMDPCLLPTIVGKVEDDGSIYIYVAE